MNENIRRQTWRHLRAQPDNLVVVCDDFLKTPIQAIILLGCERIERLVRLCMKEIKADAWKAPSNQCCVCLMLTYFSFNQCVDTWSNDFELARQMCTNPEEQTVGTVDASDCHHSRPDWSHEYELEKGWPSDVEGETVGRFWLEMLTDFLNFH